MRIAHIIDLLNWGGAQKLEVTFAAAARARRLDFTVISLRHDANTPIPDELTALGARVVTFPARHLFDPVRIGRIAGFLRRERFDVAQTHLAYANIIGILAGRLAGVPVVATLHSVGFDRRHDHPLKQAIEALAIRFGARRIVAVGAVVAHTHYARLGGRAIDVIQNAVPLPPPLTPTQRSDLRAQLLADVSQPLLISVGRFSPPKGYGDLVAAFAELHHLHPTARLIIVGDGALRAEVEAQIAELGLQHHVRLLGARNDVPQLLSASDVYVSASHWEGLPLTVLEAMAAGLPIVATGVGDVPRVVVAGTGVIVPPRDPSALAKALRNLLAEPERMRVMGQTAQAHIARHFNSTVWLDNLLAVYAQAQTRHSAAQPSQKVAH
jgi:glycosyltransferase involved in cell wall biosynthesis